SRATHARSELRMPIEALPALTFAFAVAGVALALAIFVRLRRAESSSRALGLETTITKMEQGLRDELARGRQESATGSKLLRDEVIGAFAALADNLRKAMADLSAGAGGQLDGFGDRLHTAQPGTPPHPTPERPGRADT